MISTKWILFLSVIILLSVQSVFAISNVQHSVDGNKVTLTYQGTPPFWINIRGDTNIGQAGGYLWAKTYSNSFSYDMSFAINPSKKFYYGVKDRSWSGTNSFIVGGGDNKCQRIFGNATSFRSLNFFFVGVNYDNNQIFCGGKCDLSNNQKILESDINKILFSEDTFIGYGPLIIEPYRLNLDNINVFMITEPLPYTSSGYIGMINEKVIQNCENFDSKDRIIGIVDGELAVSIGHNTGIVSVLKRSDSLNSVACVLVHELGHSFGLTHYCCESGYGYDYEIDVEGYKIGFMHNSTLIPNCDNTAGCPKWCGGAAKEPFENPCRDYTTKEECEYKTPKDDSSYDEARADLNCIWIEDGDPYFKSKCVRNGDPKHHNIGTDCIEGTGCYWGCNGAGFRPTKEGGFGGCEMQKTDSLGKKHTYDAYSEKFINDILQCCYPVSCSNYNKNYCLELSKIYPNYANCSACNI